MRKPGLDDGKVSSPTVSAARPADAIRRGRLERLGWAASTAYAKYGAHRCPQLAAAISYHVLFALVPLFTFLATVFGLLLKDEARRQELIDNIVAAFPLTAEAGVDLDRILADLPTPVSAIGVVSIAALLWSASGMMASLRVGLSAALDDGGEARPFFQSKLVDVLLVLAVAVLLLVLFGASIVLNAIEQWSSTVERHVDALGLNVGGVFGHFAASVLTFAILLGLYRFVPPSRPRFGDLWIGALLAAVGAELVKVGFGLYLGTVANYDLVYGSLGSVFAFLFVVYLIASVVLFGAEFSSAWARSAVPESRETVSDASARKRLTGAIRGLFVRG